MKIIWTFLMITACSVSFLRNNAYAQKPGWVDNPGMYSAENFVGVGVAKDNKPDQARDKSAKKAKAGIEQVLKSKYSKKDIKAAMASARIEAYWQDPVSKYYYAIALLPIETIDKSYASQKKADKARTGAMDALKRLNAQTNDPDVIVVKVDDEIEQEENATTETEAKKENEQSSVVKKEASATVTSVTSSSSAVAGGTTDFKSKSMGSFKWSDQDQNSKYSFLGDGNMTVNVAADETWDPKEGIKKAPRVELTDIKGDFTAIAKVKADWSKYYVGVGICAHNGKQNIVSKVYYNGSYLYLEGFAGDIDLPRTEKYVEPFKGFVYLKLVRKGYLWTAYYSTIEDDWVEVASIETEFPESCNAGVVFLNSEGSTTAMKVEFVKIIQ